MESAARDDDSDAEQEQGDPLFAAASKPAVKPPADAGLFADSDDDEEEAPAAPAAPATKPPADAGLFGADSDDEHQRGRCAHA